MPLDLDESGDEAIERHRENLRDLNEDRRALDSVHCSLKRRLYITLSVREERSDDA